MSGKEGKRMVMLAAVKQGEVERSDCWGRCYRQAKRIWRWLAKNTMRVWCLGIEKRLNRGARARNCVLRC